MLVDGVESGAVDRLFRARQDVALTGGRGLDGRGDRIAIGLGREAPDIALDRGVESGGALTSSTRQ